ncbi:MAG: 2-hydroxy-3-oxopropionate reductase [Dehalococcoidales bacterium]|nr:2-hydroxy-3-oxopropionate reductase [Dehalococcoidales bacterium]
MDKKIGFIGLGIMGKPMSLNLLKAGFDVTVYNRTESKTAEPVSQGAKKAESPAEATADSTVIITIVSDTPDVESVILGGNGVIESIRPDSVVIDMSTIAPEATRKIAARLKEKGAHMLDAPVSGGEQGAIDGTLSIMTGGETAIFQRCLPVLQAMGKNVIHVGSNGMGQTVKLVNQILVTGTLNSVAEALIFASKSGVDLEKTIDAVKGGAAGSWQLTNLAPRIIERDFRPGFMIDLLIKDLNLVTGSAEEMGIDLLVTSRIKEMYEKLQAEGEGKNGTQALIKALEKLTGVRVEK